MLSLFYSNSEFAGDSHWQAGRSRGPAGAAARPAVTVTVTVTVTLAGSFKLNLKFNF
jgi:hypothetical protein